MQFLSKINSKKFKLYLWKIEESESELKKEIIINDSLRKRLNSLKSLDHRKGVLSIQQLIRIANIKENELNYDLHGAPILKSGKHISISHSKYFSGIIISDFNIGIDIEFFRDKILKIGSKFTNEDENYALGKIEDLTFIWTAKEAIYKAFRTPGISFSDQIHVGQLKKYEKKQLARVDFNNQFKLYDLTSFKLNSSIITIALEKI